MREIDNSYYELIEPTNFRKVIGNEDQFIEWVEMGTKEDLISALKEFENAELYEDCIIIKKYIDDYGK